MRPTRSESVHPPPRAPLPIQNRPPSRPVRAASELVDQTGRERQPAEPERCRSRWVAGEAWLEAGPGAEPMSAPPASLPSPPSKSQAEDPLSRAPGSDSNKPAAPSGASVADLQKTTAPKTPPKHPAPQGSQKPPAAAPVISVDDEQMFQATQRSSYEQLRDQISQRAKGRNAVDCYEEGMTPLLSYMFFVLHYHENLLTTEKSISGPLSCTAKCAIILIALYSPDHFLCRRPKIFKDEAEEVLRFLLTRFGTADRPFLPVIPIGQREIVTLARSVIAAGTPIKKSSKTTPKRTQCLKTQCTCGNCPHART